MMLQMLSHSNSPSYAPSHDHQAAMTASLALLPQHTPAHPSQDAVNVKLPQRPRLHINTQQLRTFGKGSSLRLDTLSAVSPTRRNTFANAYEPPTAATPASNQRPRLGLSIDSSIANPPTVSTPNSASTLSSALTSTSSNESATIKIPYKQPHNLTSILSNSPARDLIPRKMAPARPLFPAEKKVSFRTPLEEEITTTKYTMAHSDLQSSQSSVSTLASIEVPVASESESSSISLSISTSSSSSDASTSSPEHTTSPKRGPQTGDKRDSSESDSDSAPETPVAGRRKRRRDWRWTLGPLPGSKSSTSESTSSTSDMDPGDSS